MTSRVVSRVIWAAAVLVVTTSARAEDCAALAGMKLDHGVVTAAAEVGGDSATTSTTSTTSTSSTSSTSSTRASTYCRVQAVSRPTADSDIRFELWIPLGDAWNGKFEQVGNGGFAGKIPSRSMVGPLSRGYAVAGTDDGHESEDMTDARWALHHEEKIKDYGWRAIRDTAVASKLILRRFKARTPSKSYFVGCSDGGREALMMAQRFPDYFDGIVAGAPAYAMSRLLTGGAVRAAQLNSAEGHLSPAKLSLLQSAALKSCGNDARYLPDPRQCHPDLAALTCAGPEQATCLTAAQAATAKLLYSDQADPVRGVLYGVLPGAEAVKGSWDAWLTGTDDGATPAGVGFTRNYLVNMVIEDPQGDPAKVSTQELAHGELHYAPIMDATDPNLSAFQSRGGKLIQYHGWNDPGIAPGYSLEYYNRVLAAMGPGRVEEFYRLYMVPGMLHCGGGDAPTQVDWQAAIEAWVEHGVAPGVLTARDSKGATQSLTPFVR
jgi:feruloyl esterase